MSSEPRRQEYYRGLQQASERLHRLVESLLDFGRMQAGAQPYRFESLETGSFFREVVEDFGQEVRQRGYQVEITQQPLLPYVRADREALARALWNLLCSQKALQKTQRSDARLLARSGMGSSLP